MAGPRTLEDHPVVRRGPGRLARRSTAEAHGALVERPPGGRPPGRTISNGGLGAAPRIGHTQDFARPDNPARGSGHAGVMPGQPHHQADLPEVPKRVGSHAGEGKVVKRGGHKHHRRVTTEVDSVIHHNSPLKRHNSVTEAIQCKTRKKKAQRARKTERYADRAWLDALFVAHDPEGDGTGALGDVEWRQLLASVGVHMSDKDAYNVLKRIALASKGDVPHLHIEDFGFFFSHCSDGDSMRTTILEMLRDGQAYLKKVFHEFKEPSCAGLRLKDLRELFTFLNFEFEEHDLAFLFKQVDLDGNGTVEEDEFLFFFDQAKNRSELHRMVSSGSTGNKHFLSRVFDSFDTQKKGYLRVEDLSEVSSFMGVKLTPSSAKALFDRIDVDGSQTVEKSEFIEFFAAIKNMQDLRAELELHEVSHKRTVVIWRVYLVVTVVGTLVFGIMSISNSQFLVLTGIFGAGLAVFFSAIFGCDVCAGAIACAARAVCTCSAAKASTWLALLMVLMFVVMASHGSTHGWDITKNLNNTTGTLLISLAIVCGLLLVGLIYLTIAGSGGVSGGGYAVGDEIEAWDSRASNASARSPRRLGQAARGVFTDALSSPRRQTSRPPAALSAYHSRSRRGKEEV